MVGHEVGKIDCFAELCECYSVGDEKSLKFPVREMTTLDRKIKLVTKLGS